MAIPRTPRRSKRLGRGRGKFAPQNRSPEADTVKKSRFYSAIDHRGNKTKADVYKDLDIPPRTASYWLKQRQSLGPLSMRRTRPLSEKLGRKPSYEPKAITQLLSPSNPVRNQHYEAQINHYDIPIKARQLRNALRKHTRGAALYKKVKIKMISPQNKVKRVQYGHDHKNDTISGFWQYVHFSDEKHVDPGAVRRERILREEGTAYEIENMQEMPPFRGAQLHMATSISWNHKGRIQWYNDEIQPVISQQREPKPRKSKYETQETFDRRIEEWRARLPPEIEVKPKGNSMTQDYYTKRLLPYYLQELNQAKELYGRAIFQEDNDPSHGTRSNKTRKTPNPAQRFKQDNQMETMVHPAQSPDLNAIEPLWGILFQRVRKHEWNSIAQLKQIIEEEWKRIDQLEIQKLIADMPHRCDLLIRNNGAFIKTQVW